MVCVNYGRIKNHFVPKIWYIEPTEMIVKHYSFCLMPFFFFFVWNMEVFLDPRKHKDFYRTWYNDGELQVEFEHTSQSSSFMSCCECNSLIVKSCYSNYPPLVLFSRIEGPILVSATIFIYLFLLLLIFT
jgi:hypothetical protein